MTGPDTPPRAASERFLQDFHDRMPGGSPPAFTLCTLRDEEGIEHVHTYAAIVAAVERGLVSSAAQTLRLLDLACGDGFLLQQLVERSRNGWPANELFGIDMSRGELALARQRLGDSVQLLLGYAQALPFGHASVDVLTCHMALMLMDEPDAVLREIARVLTPTGSLVALVGASLNAPGQPLLPVWRAWEQALSGEARSPEWQSVRFPAGARWRQRETLQSMLAAHFAEVQINRLEGSLSLTADEAWQWLAGMYDLHLLPADAHPRVHRRFIELAGESTGLSGRLQLDLASWLIVAKKVRAIGLGTVPT